MGNLSSEGKKLGKCEKICNGKKPASLSNQQYSNHGNPTINYDNVLVARFRGIFSSGKNQLLSIFLGKWRQGDSWKAVISTKIINESS